MGACLATPNVNKEKEQKYESVKPTSPDGEKPKTPPDYKSEDSSAHADEYRGSACTSLLKRSHSLEENSSYVTEKEISSKYTVERILGEGASCQVFKVIDEDGERVALKKLDRNDQGNYKLFIREVHILKKMNHPNLVTIKADFYSNTNLYIMTELCEGGELFDHIVECRKFNEVKAAEYTRTMMSAIQYLHQQNICHRDLKPENFCLKTRGDNAKLILIDFGVAREVQPEEKYKGVVGTPFYLAPEYLSRVSRDGNMLLKADIWSIGVITYIMVTGSPPFGGRNNAQIFKNVVAGILRYPNIPITESCKNFISKLLTQDPSARPTADEVLNEEWLGTSLTKQQSVNLTSVVSMLARFQQASKLHKAIRPLVDNQMKILGWEPSIKDQLDMKALFQTLDKDNDGQLTYEELKNYLSQRKGSLYGETAALAIMETSDSNADGQLSFDEYFEAMKAKVIMKDEKICKKVFNILDLNKDGKLTIAELCSALNISKKTANDLVNESDTGKTGYLSFDEFKATLTKDNFSIASVGNHSVTVNREEIEQFVALQEDKPLPDAILQEPSTIPEEPTEDSNANEEAHDSIFTMEKNHDDA